MTVIEHWFVNLKERWEFDCHAGFDLGPNATLFSYPRDAKAYWAFTPAPREGEDFDFAGISGDIYIENSFYVVERDQDLSIVINRKLMDSIYYDKSNTFISWD